MLSHTVTAKPTASGAAAGATEAPRLLSLTRIRRGPRCVAPLTSLNHIFSKRRSPKAGNVLNHGIDGEKQKGKVKICLWPQRAFLLAARCASVWRWNTTTNNFCLWDAETWGSVSCFLRLCVVALWSTSCRVPRRTWWGIRSRRSSGNRSML